MNERILALAEEAKKSVPHGVTTDKWIETYNIKLAKLIVLECADVAYKFDELTIGQGYTVAKHIKKHFGVE
jgi:hypothetical protein